MRSMAFNSAFGTLHLIYFSMRCAMRQLSTDMREAIKCIAR